MSGRRHTLIVAPTGSGKAILSGKIAALAAPKGRVLVLCSQSHLIKQNLDKFNHFCDIEAGVYCQSLNRKDTDHQVIFASRDSLGRNPSICGSFGLIILDECFPPDVEILTEDGFVRFDQLSEEKKVAQVDKDSLKISFCKPTDHIKKWVNNSKLISLKSDKRIDISMTENHEILFLDRNKSKTFKQSISQFSNKFNVNYSMFRAGFAESLESESELTPFEKLLIAFQADGSFHSSGRAYFSFSKERKIEDFLNLMNEGNFTFKEVSSCGKVNSKNIKLKRRFSVEMKYKTKFLDEYFKLEETSLEKAKNIIEYMVKWDGSILSQNSYYYSSKEKRNCDFYQAMCCLCGYSTNKIIQEDNRSEKFSAIHRLFIHKDTNRIGLQGLSKTESSYTGHVYCVRVPKGNIVVRRNGKPLIIGNCHQAVVECGNSNNNTMYGRIFSAQPNALVVGMTGTPWRLSGGKIWGEDKFFQGICYNIGMDVLRKQGFLVPYKFPLVNTKIDTEGIKTQNGDFNIKELEERTSNEFVIKESIQEWLIYEKFRKCTMFFCVTRNHGQKICKALQAYLAEDEIVYVDGETKDRDAILEDIRQGKYKAVVSIGALTTGFDAPIVDCIVMLRATKSTSLFVQICGRGLRPYPGKEDLLILDFAQNFTRFGSLELPRVTNMYIKDTPSEKNADVQKKKCPSCKLDISFFARECGYCGEIFKLSHSAKAHKVGDKSQIHRCKVLGVSVEPHIKKDTQEGGFMVAWRIIAQNRMRVLREYFMVNRKTSIKRLYEDRLAQIRAKPLYVTCHIDGVFIQPIDVETEHVVLTRQG